MKKLAVILSILCFAGTSLPDVSQAEITSREARQLRLADRHMARAKKKAQAKVDINSLCTDLDLLAGNLLHKSEGSGHLQGDARGNKCALIWGSGNYNFPKSNTFRMYDSQGNFLVNYRTYERNGCPFPLRVYSDWNKGAPTCKQIAAMALRNTGNREAYIYTGGGSCMKLKSILGRQGGNRAGTITSNKAQCRKR